MNVSMQVVGTETVLALLARAGAAGEAAASAGPRASADAIAADARERAPVGDPEGGHMRDTIEVIDQGDVVLVHVGAPYAGYVEYGTSQENYPAQPFLRPAVDSIGLKPALAVAVTILRSV